MHQGRGDSPAPKNASPAAGIAAEEVLKTVLTSLEDSKSENIVTIDIGRKSSLGDYMVVASGRSHRHVGSVSCRCQL